MAMMQHDPELTLKGLNVSTLAWVEQEYHRTVHGDLKTTPLDAMIRGNHVERPCPGVEELRFAFTQKVPRTQRRSDGTLSLEGIRFEVPSHLRHVNRLWVRFRRWDLSSATIVDERDYKAILAHIRPIDKTKNADGRRRVLEATMQEVVKATIEAPPLLQKIMSDFAATGLPPVYIPHEEEVSCGK